MQGPRDGWQLTQPPSNPIHASLLLVQIQGPTDGQAAYNASFKPKPLTFAPSSGCSSPRLELAPSTLCAQRQVRQAGRCSSSRLNWRHPPSARTNEDKKGGQAAHKAPHDQGWVIRETHLLMHGKCCTSKCGTQLACVSLFNPIVLKSKTTEQMKLELSKIVGRDPPCFQLCVTSAPSSGIQDRIDTQPCVLETLRETVTKSTVCSMHEWSHGPSTRPCNLLASHVRAADQDMFCYISIV
eukprot:scaffold1838_cov18-Tisochrysis_lutea.AAC.1